VAHPEFLGRHVQSAVVPDVPIEQDELTDAALVQRIDDVLDHADHGLGPQGNRSTEIAV
jgi:hypothetical protein